MTCEVAGACSGGLTMTRLPAAKAAMTGFIVSRSGKFHGAMTSTTPLGWLTISDRPEQLDGRRTPLRTHPIPEMLPHEGDLLADGKELRQPGFCFGLSQILLQGLQEGILVVAEPAQHVRQQGTALAQRGRRLHPMGRPEGLKGRSQFLVGQSFSNSLMLPTLPSMPLASYGMKTTRDLSLEVSIIFSSAST